MDRPESSASDCDPSVTAILERTRRLTSDELVTLAKRYLAATAPEGPRDMTAKAGAPKPFDRRRTITIARSRSARDRELRAVEVAVADAVRSIGSVEEHRALVRLGLLDAAERAVTDAVLSVLLADRLGAAQASELRGPWEAVA
jgi:hypothetical protein